VALSNAMAKDPSSRRRSPIDVFRYHDYRAFLSDLYKAKKRNGFSYRAFSRTAGLGAPNYLKLVIEGQRNLTPQMAERFAEACGLSGDAAEYFLRLVEFNQASSAEQKSASFTSISGFDRYRRAHRLELAQAAYHSTWYLPAIRELVTSAAFQDDPAKIAAQLWPAIKPSEAKFALDTLLELGLLERDAEGRLRQTAAVVSTGPETFGMHITNYHAEMMRRAAQSMGLVPSAQRDISSVTFCVGPDAAARIKKRIQEFRRELIALVEAEANRGQVLQLNLQLFPLSLPAHEAEAAAQAPAKSPKKVRPARKHRPEDGK
jgi:uncharacterized protein (TIGR02147 family)